MPDQLKLPFALWSRRAVQDLVRRRWSIELPIRTVGDYLKRWGFTPQKPLKRDYGQNAKAVAAWLLETYPAIRLSAKRHSLNLISTVTNQGKVRFMTRLIKDADRKVFLVLDNLRVHHSKKVKAWLQGREHQIEVFYLPSYSPELNPDEYLNCDLKAGVHSGPPARSKDDLKRKTIAHLRRVQKTPARAQSYFQHPKIAYAA